MSISPVNLIFDAIDLEGTTKESGVRTISGLIAVNSEKLKKPIIGIIPSSIEMAFASVETIMYLMLNIFCKSTSYILYLIDFDNSSRFFEWCSAKTFQMIIQSTYVLLTSSVNFFTLGFKRRES